MIKPNLSRRQTKSLNPSRQISVPNNDPVDSSPSFVTNPYPRVIVPHYVPPQRDTLRRIDSKKSSADSLFAIPLNRSATAVLAEQSPLGGGIKDSGQDYGDSSSVTNSLTQKNMRRLAIQLVQMERRLGHIHSDEVYAARMTALVNEERQRMIEEDVNSSRDDGDLTTDSFDQRLDELRNAAPEGTVYVRDELERGRTLDRGASTQIIDRASPRPKNPRRIKHGARRPFVQSDDETKYQAAQDLGAYQVNTARVEDRTNVKRKIFVATTQAAMGAAGKSMS
jgi:hypothetical protein